MKRFKTIFKELSEIAQEVHGVKELHEILNADYEFMGRGASRVTYGFTDDTGMKCVFKVQHESSYGSEFKSYYKANDVEATLYRKVKKEYPSLYKLLVPMLASKIINKYKFNFFPMLEIVPTSLDNIDEDNYCSWELASEKMYDVYHSDEDIHKNREHIIDIISGDWHNGNVGLHKGFLYFLDANMVDKFKLFAADREARLYFKYYENNKELQESLATLHC